MNWSRGASGNWAAFAADFFPGAALFPAARPARRQSVEGFIERMQGLAGTTLRSLRESVLGIEVRVFGNIAVAVAGCELTENDTEVNRGVEMLLLVRSEGAWQVVAQAWDTEGASQRLPAHLATRLAPWSARS
jgi:hypothetical protein